MANSILLVNNYYPISYFSSNSIVRNNNTQTGFWASNEALPPAQEYLVFDLQNTRQVNFIDFEISAKPIDIQVFYGDPNTNIWTEITPQPVFFNYSLSIPFLPSTTNPWFYFELHFLGGITTRYLKVVFTRRTDPFPLDTSPAFPWSIEVRNTRVSRIIVDANDATDDLGVFIPDTGIDILGNLYRTDFIQNTPDLVLDDDAGTYWLSQPNPSQQAVESLYFDIRLGNSFQLGTMAFLDQSNMNTFNTRSMTDVELYHDSGQVINEIYIDPVTTGNFLHIYWSNDDYPVWDYKLWTPVSQHYILHRGFHVLPYPIKAKYIKLEFTNLSPVPYNTIYYPDLPPITYRKYPQWVQDFFAAVPNTPSPSIDKNDILHPFDQVSIDPISFGFITLTDLISNTTTVTPLPIINTTSELTTAVNIIATQSQVNADSRSQVEDEIKFFSSFAYQEDLIAQLDNSRALSRFVQQNQISLAPTEEFNSETNAPVSTPPTAQSAFDLTIAAREKNISLMWFPIICRHGYQELQAPRPTNIAFFVGIKEVAFYRRDFSQIWDEPFYIETLNDQINLELNDLTLDEWRYEVN